MLRKVQILVEGRRLELFNDEKIEVNSSVQNIADISKVFTDFSQTFSIPCSDANNQIFQHFYQTDVDASVDHNIRRNAVIEIDLTFFRRGKISIEKANVKKGNADNYQVTFYGDVLSLKDKFKEDQLNTLNYSHYNHEYNGSQVKDRITDGAGDYDVRYPLISSNRIWQYNSSNPFATYPSYLPPAILAQLPVADIDLTGGAIAYQELFPALRISAIFTEIQAKYGVTFKGTFLTDKRFRDMFLWFKNKNTFAYTTPLTPIAFDYISSGSALTYDLTPNINFTTNSINVLYIQDVFMQNIQLGINTLSVPTSNLYVDVFQNGNFFQTLNFPAGTYIANVSVPPNASGLNDLYTFKIKTDVACDIIFDITYSVSYNSATSFLTDFVTVTTQSIAFVLFTDLAGLAPEMKIGDFFAGILKEFNLTCYPVDVDTYQIETLESWYSKGAIIDITKYTDVNSIDIERIKLFKNISFKYQKSESFMNKEYFQIANKEYGDTTYKFNYDGDEFVIDSPFENLMFNKFTGTKMQVGYCLNSSFAPYIPKPCLLYKGEQLSTFFYYNDNATISTVDNYVSFGQDLLYNNQNYTSNFGPENSTMLNIPIANTIYGVYYFPYLANLFNLKNRLTSVKTNLPISLTTGLKLNDRVIIRDKRYIINEMKLDLTTGESNFTLINDFRPLISRGIEDGKTEGGDIVIPIVFPNGTTKPSFVVNATITGDLADVYATPATVYEEQNVVITLPAITPGPFPIVNTISIVFTFEDGTTTTHEKYIKQ